MKKLILISTVFALAVTSLAEARGVRVRTSSPAKAVVTKPVAKQNTTQQKTATNQQTQQKDATFANTPNNSATQAQRPANNTMANVAMGAAAGYILGDMMSSNAHANQIAETNAQQAVNSGQNIANAMPMIAEFRSIGGQIDPFLVEKTDGYRRYCIAGVQYLAPAQGGQTTPIVMVNPNGSPLQCNLVP